MFPACTAVVAHSNALIMHLNLKCNRKHIQVNVSICNLTRHSISGMRFLGPLGLI
jgi:hypothetical protein